MLVRRRSRISDMQYLAVATLSTAQILTRQALSSQLHKAAVAPYLLCTHVRQCFVLVSILMVC